MDSDTRELLRQLTEGRIERVRGQHPARPRHAFGADPGGLRRRRLAAVTKLEERRLLESERPRQDDLGERLDAGVQVADGAVVVVDVLGQRRGKLVISTRERAYKTRNLRRDPTAVLCVFADAFFGRWMQIQGTAQVVSLPAAMDGLIDYYRRISGEHPDWDDYRRAMQQQRRVLVRVSIDTVGPSRAG